MSAHEGSPPKPVSPCSSGPGSAKILGWPDSKPGRGRLRVPQVGKLPVGGEPFTIVCNLFSKIYFVTIYLSFKKGKLLPKPHPPKNNFFFSQQLLVWLFLKDWIENTGDISVEKQSLGVGPWPHMESISGQVHSQPDGCQACLQAGWEPQDRQGKGRRVKLGVDVGVAWLFWRPVSKLKSHHQQLAAWLELTRQLPGSASGSGFSAK